MEGGRTPSLGLGEPLAGGGGAWEWPAGAGIPPLPEGVLSGTKVPEEPRNEGGEMWLYTPSIPTRCSPPSGSGLTGQSRGTPLLFSVGTLRAGGGNAQLCVRPPPAYTPLLGPVFLLSSQAQSLPPRGAAVLFFWGWGHVWCVLGGFRFWGGCTFPLGYMNCLGMHPAL